MRIGAIGLLMAVGAPMAAPCAADDVEEERAEITAKGTKCWKDDDLN
jgi:hypothetical protein